MEHLPARTPVERAWRPARRVMPTMRMITSLALIVRGRAYVQLRAHRIGSVCRSQRPLTCCLATGHRSKPHRHPDPVVPSSPDAWERWEFGNEAFIDRALAEPAAISSTHRDNLADVDAADSADATAADAAAAGAEATSSSASRFTGDCVPVDRSTGETSYLGALRALRPFVSEERRAKMDEVLALRSGNVRFVIEDPINPSNAWACLRTLDSYGVQYVDVITNPARYEASDGAQLAKRRMTTAMGCAKWLDLAQHQSSTACVAKLKAEGFTVLATDLGEGSVPLTSLNLANMGPVAIVMGNEQRGISEEMRSLCDQRVFIPMRGFAQSLSLSVGCAAVASHLDAVNAVKPGSLGPEERARILFRWTLEAVRAGKQILRRAGFDLGPGGRPDAPRQRIMGHVVK